jgi:hypothetical protein
MEEPTVEPTPVRTKKQRVKPRSSDSDVREPLVEAAPPPEPACAPPPEELEAYEGARDLSAAVAAEAETEAPGPETPEERSPCAKEIQPATRAASGSALILSPECDKSKQSLLDPGAAPPPPPSEFPITVRSVRCLWRVAAADVAGASPCGASALR